MHGCILMYCFNSVDLDYVSSYLEHVKNRSENVSLTIPFYLHYVSIVVYTYNILTVINQKLFYAPNTFNIYGFVIQVMEPNENVPDMIFAVIIQIQTSSNYKKIQGILPLKTFSWN